METPSTVKPYNPDESKKQQVERMFDNIAPKYDLLNRLLSLGIDVWWRKKAISYLKTSDPKEILDVATGTADVAIMMTQMLNPQKITGVDISNLMLDFGRVKIKEKKLAESGIWPTKNLDILKSKGHQSDNL